MSLSNYNPHMRYKERAAQRTVRFFTMLCIVLFSASVGFWLGKQYAAEQILSLREQISGLTKQSNLLQDSVTELRAEAQTANTRYEQLRAEFDAQMPEGPMRDLAALIRGQIEQGMDPGRLSFLIRSARPPSDCTEPETKRFVVSTPAYNGPASAVSVAEGAIVITGSGLSAKNERGRPEAWFDPAQPVRIIFKSKQMREVKKGPLPIKYSMIAGDREYRFTVEAGARSFAKVIFDSCAYP
jgi:cell division protein FtsB